MRLYARYTKKPLSTFDKVNTKTINITVLEENDKDITPFMPNEYNNKGGNCGLCAICDLYNYIEDTNVYKPVARNDLNNREYVDLCKVIHSECTWGCSLKELSNKEFTGYVVVACYGGYHAIAMIKGKILNNWNNRFLQTLKEFREEISYARMPKAFFSISINTLLSRKKEIVNAINKMISISLGK